MIGSACTPSPVMKKRGPHPGMAQRHRRRFRAPARCQSEAGVPSRTRAFSRSARRALRPSGPRAGLKTGVPLPAVSSRRSASRHGCIFTAKARPYLGMAQRHRRWFRAPARCRPEAGVPSRPRAFSRSARRFAALRAACRSEGPHRETGQRSLAGGVIQAVGVPARLHFHSKGAASPWHGATSSALVSRSRAMPAGGRRSKPSPRFFSVGETRFAALRAACRSEGPHRETGQRSLAGGVIQAVGVPARLHFHSKGAALPWHGATSSALVSRSRAMLAGGRRSKPSPRFFPVGETRFAALRAACRSEDRRSLAGGVIQAVGVPARLHFHGNWAAWVSPQAARAAASRCRR